MPFPRTARCSSMNFACSYRSLALPLAGAAVAAARLASPRAPASRQARTGPWWPAPRRPRPPRWAAPDCPHGRRGRRAGRTSVTCRRPSRERWCPRRQAPRAETPGTANASATPPACALSERGWPHPRGRDAATVAPLRAGPRRRSAPPPRRRAPTRALSAVRSRSRCPRAAHLRRVLRKNGSFPPFFLRVAFPFGWRRTTVIDASPAPPWLCPAGVNEARW